MKVVFCWQTVSGYMAACWRELASRSGIDLHVIARRPGGAAAFDPSIMSGISHELFDQADLDRPKTMLPIVRAQKPDVVVLCGWASKSWPAVAKDPDLGSAARVMTMDTPFQGTLRQKLGGLVHKSYFQRIHRVFVAGERTRQLALTLGFRDAQIRASTYGFDFDTMAQGAAVRDPQSPPRQFLFVGRYVPVKGIDTLLEAYAQYRQRVSDPWTLACCGKGELASDLAKAEGVIDHGFTQPADLPAHLAASSAFVLASDFEPWGVVVAEAAAAGLPIVCTDAVGAAIDMVRPFYSGLTVAPRDPRSLADALVYLHEHPERTVEMGLRAREYARAYSAQAWSDRWEATLNEFAR